MAKPCMGVITRTEIRAMTASELKDISSFAEMERKEKLLGQPSKQGKKNALFDFLYGQYILEVPENDRFYQSAPGGGAHAWRARRLLGPGWW